jgi:hypothetical protein
MATFDTTQPSEAPFKDWRRLYHLTKPSRLGSHLVNRVRIWDYLTNILDTTSLRWEGGTMKSPDDVPNDFDLWDGFGAANRSISGRLLSDDALNDRDSQSLEFSHGCRHFYTKPSK